MPYIKTIPQSEAEGLLAQLYHEAIRRAGKVFNIVSLQSLTPHVLRAGIQLYEAIMHHPSGLTRAQKEMIATVVSKELGCFY